MSSVIRYDCPSCGGRVEFDAGLQKCKCPYCDTEYEVETLRKLDAFLNETPEERQEWDQTPSDHWTDEDGTRIFTCSACGGELLTDHNTSATSCPYCSSPVVLKERVQGDLKPDLVVPFRLSREAAVDALHAFFKGKPLLPKVFKNELELEKVQGIYVPFWLFDVTTKARIRYRATKVRFWSDSRYQYTETRHYSVLRGGKCTFESVPIDGSVKLDNALMESIEPFRMDEACDFQTAYLSGYLADRYDADTNACIPRANERVRIGTERAFRSTVIGYQSVTPQHSSISYENGKIRYALLPVWLFHAKWKDQNFLFAVNGQTGRVAGDLPLDVGAMFRWFFGITIPLTAIIVLIRYLLSI